MQIKLYFILLTKIAFKLKGIFAMYFLYITCNIYVFFVRHFDYQKLHVHTSKYFAYQGFKPIYLVFYFYVLFYIPIYSLVIFSLTSIHQIKFSWYKVHYIRYTASILFCPYMPSWDWEDEPQILFQKGLA